MKPLRRYGVVAVVVAASLGVVARGCGKRSGGAGEGAVGGETGGKGSGDAGTGKGASVKPKPTAWVEPLTIGPITYFNTQCSSCHGDYGKQIADHNIAKTSSAEDYRSMVDYMVTVRSESSLAPRELDAQTAYCSSLAAVGEGVASEGSPTFVCVKTPVRRGGLEGEVTPGSKVTLVAARGQVRIDAKVSGHSWEISPQQVSAAKSSAGAAWVDAVIEARGAPGTPAQRLVLAEEAFKGPVLKPRPRPPVE
ncbi:MAG TPA: hypothetical protein VEB22_08345 [Phycisphaerales bacterium]|nr:hypothetical protein [Phycisphaerales bacterium]